MIIALDVAKFSEVWAPIIIQLVITSGAVFGGAGFWQWKQSREQAKRDEKSKESGIEKKIEILSDQVTSLDLKVETVSEDVQQMAQDMKLLERANENAKKYLDARSKQDKEVMEAQKAIIESLTGLLRERLLENYNRCMTKGYYSREERETYGELFKCYESAPFNGNGIMHQLQPKMLELPWTKEEADLISKK